MRHLQLVLIAITFVSGCGKALENTDTAKPSAPKSSMAENTQDPQQSLQNTTLSAKKTSDGKAVIASDSPIGIWRNKIPDEGLLSQAVEIKANGDFAITILSANGLLEFEGKWKKASDSKIDFEPGDFELANNVKVSGRMVNGEMLEFNFGSQTLHLTRATSDIYEYPATEAEKAKFVGVWKAKKSLPQFLSESQTLNADGTAVYDVTHRGDFDNKLPGRWTLVTTDVIVITRWDPGKRGEQYFKCTGKLIDKDTLDIELVDVNTIFLRQ